MTTRAQKCAEALDSGAFNDFTDEDFAAFALVALDQADVGPATRERIRRILSQNFYDDDFGFADEQEIRSRLERR